MDPVQLDILIASGVAPAQTSLLSGMEEQYCIMMVAPGVRMDFWYLSGTLNSVWGSSGSDVFAVGRGKVREE